MEEQYFALLIDADNVSAKYITPILTELSKYGVITYKRIYGDRTSTLNVFLEAGTADEFDHADPAVQLHDRKEVRRILR